MERLETTGFGTARYRLGAPLGAGGMGTVYRAHDRLTGQDVALKCVELAPEQLAFASRPSSDDEQALRLALAHEFRTLAGLRHPYIISVLDYGFDARQQPFFTMELLDGAQTLLEAGRDLPIARRAELLLHGLEALAYLHRRGVLHHDLKPANMLVASGRLRLLDFGLAVAADARRDDDTFGTLLYLAPEVLNGQPYTAASDLYSLGVIAYELLLGRHPIAAESVREFIDALFAGAIDLSGLAGEPALAAALGRLMALDPDERPASAQAAIDLLRQAAGLAEAAPDRAIRESYLQAAGLVGRADELGQLRAALGRALAGAGELWLVGGESGVGKSRLLDELRAEALVAGALVATGQAVEGGGLPYQIWREPLRRLALEVAPSELEASVLRELVPDLASLLGRPLADAPALPGEAAQLRLHATIGELLRRLARPLLLMLEDLHWAGDSLALLHDLQRLLPSAPLLIVGSFRSDEWRHAAELPGAHTILLERLPPTAVADLSAAMLGAAGRSEQVLRLLQRESEGNAFFLVEVVRALAEEAGGLAQIGRATLPNSVFAGGLQQLVLRRLARMPSWAQPLLRLAAVAGRQIDLAVLGRLPEAGGRLDAWLQAGADAAVLDPTDGGWRFAHDKLREAALAELSADERPALHRQVAEAIEAAYPGERERRGYAEVLLEHWQQAGAADRAIGYALALAEWMSSYSAEYDRASAMLDLAGDLAERLPERQRWQLQVALLRGDLARMRSNFAAAQPHFELARELARQPADPRSEARALIGLADIAAWTGDLPLAERQLHAALALAGALGDQAQLADAQRLLGTVKQWQGEPAEARRLYGAALTAAGDDQPRRASIISDMSQQLGDQGDIAGATAGFEQVLAIAEALGDVAGRAFALMNIAYGQMLLREYAPARVTYLACVEVCRAYGVLSTLAHALRGLASIAEGEGDLAGALDYYRQSQAVSQSMRHHMLESLNGIVMVQARTGDSAVRATLAELLELLVGMDIPEFQIEAVAAGAAVLWALGQPRAAAELAGLVGATEASSSDARLSLGWLQPALAASLPPAELAAAQAAGAARDLHGTLDTLRAWAATLGGEAAPEPFATLSS